MGNPKVVVAAYRRGRLGELFITKLKSLSNGVSQR